MMIQWSHWQDLPLLVPGQQELLHRSQQTQLALMLIQECPDLMLRWRLLPPSLTLLQGLQQDLQELGQLRELALALEARKRLLRSFHPS